jgi:hypothetical protein
MEHRTFKNVNNCFNTHIYSYLETSGSKRFNLYLNVDFFNTGNNETSVAVWDNCFAALEYNMPCSIQFLFTKSIQNTELKTFFNHLNINFTY